MQFLSSLFADNRWLTLGASVVAFLIFAILVLLFVRLLFGNRLYMSGGRGRQQRLGYVDSYDLDRQRRLVLVRRDNTEHLVMIGGPNDLVIESTIVRAEVRESRERSGSPLRDVPAAELPRVPIPEPRPAAVLPPAPGLAASLAPLPATPLAPPLPDPEPASLPVAAPVAPQPAAPKRIAAELPPSALEPALPSAHPVLARTGEEKAAEPELPLPPAPPPEPPPLVSAPAPAGRKEPSRLSNPFARFRAAPAKPEPEKPDVLPAAPTAAPPAAPTAAPPAPPPIPAAVDDDAIDFEEEIAKALAPSGRGRIAQTSPTTPELGVASSASSTEQPATETVEPPGPQPVFPPPRPVFRPFPTRPPLSPRPTPSGAGGEPSSAFPLRPLTPRPPPPPFFSRMAQKPKERIEPTVSPEPVGAEGAETTKTPAAADVPPPHGTSPTNVADSHPSPEHPSPDLGPHPAELKPVAASPPQEEEVDPLEEEMARLLGRAPEKGG